MWDFLLCVEREVEHILLGCRGRLSATDGGKRYARKVADVTPLERDSLHPATSESGLHDRNISWDGRAVGFWYFESQSYPNRLFVLDGSGPRTVDRLCGRLRGLSSAVLPVSGS